VNAFDPEEYLTIFNEFPVMVWRLDLQGRAQYFNKAWLVFTGSKLESVAGHGWMDSLHPEDRQGCLRNYQLAADRGEAIEIECRLRRHDGLYRWTVYAGRPYTHSDGKLAGYIGACHDISEQKIASENLRLFTRRLVLVQEAERWRISRDLHDEAGQSLTALMIHLDMLQADLPPGCTLIQERVQMCIGLVHETIDLIRHLAQDLRPPALDTLGLNLTLEGYCQEFTRRTAIPVRYKGLEACSLEDEANITVYRFLQECLGNIANHAQVSKAQVTLGLDGEILSLRIEDDGQMPASQPLEAATALPLRLSADDRSESRDLLEMSERLGLLGGRVEVKSSPERGSCFIGWLPVKPSCQAEALK